VTDVLRIVIVLLLVVGNALHRLIAEAHSRNGAPSSASAVFASAIAATGSRATPP
jgi:hypothetical protein